MTNKDAIQNIFENYPSDWKKLQNTYRLLKYRQLLLIVSAVLIVLALLLYFLVPENNFEYALIPGMIAIAAFYFAFFRIRKPEVLRSEIISRIIPLIIHEHSWNIEYQYRTKPYLREFNASRLYPYTMSDLEGSNFFSGIAKQLPFIAWFVEASYIEKIGESALSMVSGSSQFSGFLGFQIMVKNLVPHLNGVIVVEKNDSEEIKALQSFYKNDPDWKEMKTDDSDFKRKYMCFTKNENPENSVNQLVISKINKISYRSSLPISLSIRKNHIFLNQYWSEDFAKFDLKKSLKENLQKTESQLRELIDLSFMLAMPG